MRTTRLGKTGLEVSRVGLGGIPIQRLTEDKAIQVVDRCLELGVMFIDTANGYTTSEERIGKALAASSVERARVVIATKTPARDRVTAREHLELSLRRMGVDTIDLWQFHNVSTFEVYEQVLGSDGAMETAQEALETGQIRHIGITSHSMEIAMEAIPSGHFETIQFPFNFVTHEPAAKLVPLAQAHNLGFIAMKPFAGGMLDKATLAIKYLLQFEGVVPDPGIESIEEIEEIASIVAGPLELTPDERQEMEQVRAEVSPHFCRRCGYCEPCPQGVRISLVVNLRSFWKRYSPAHFRRGWLATGVESGRNCIECGECEEKCPYHLPIREMLAENLAFFDSVFS